MFGSHVEAEVARGALEAAGIGAWVAADDAGGQNPQLGFSRGVVVLVAESDADRAKQVLERGGE